LNEQLKHVAKTASKIKSCMDKPKVKILEVLHLCREDFTKPVINKVLFTILIQAESLHTISLRATSSIPIEIFGW